MNKLHKSITLIILINLIWHLAIVAQIKTPSIIDVVEDDHVATLYWNSKVYSLQAQYDTDKRDSVFSYLVEWGPESEGFIYSSVTPYRAAMVQPLEPGVNYVARIFNLDNDGRKSEPSDVVEFQHNSRRVDSMRVHLNGFFDDMNRPMGAFPEKDWNQAYSGCMKIGRVSQHINNQFHGHNVQSSGACDRGVACSRVRHLFDFTDRTGVIEFDLDGAQRGRQFWYLDILPAGKKRDLTGHIQITNNSTRAEDPGDALRIIQRGANVIVQQIDSDGFIRSLDNVFENDACGEHLEYCDEENLSPLINVRRRWRIELSKSHIRIFINEKLVIDGPLTNETTPEGLPFEVAQLNWLTFSYNTPKENFVLSMIHWDNFGFDAPAGYEQTTVVHNYTDGILGTESPRVGNEFSIGMISSNEEAGVAYVRIPDEIKDQNGRDPISTELMFTIQGGDYRWTEEDRILVNGHEYMFPEPSSDIADFPAEDLTRSATPYSAILEVDPNQLIMGDNQVEFLLNRPRILNIHIELTYPIHAAPSYTPPSEAYPDHTMKLMDFLKVANTMGPGIAFTTINGDRLRSDEIDGERNPTDSIEFWYVKQTPVSGMLSLEITGNSEGQMAATGSAKGITHYNLLMDNQVFQTVRKDIESPVAYFEDHIEINTEQFSDGMHLLFVKAYDVNGTVSTFDTFEGSADPGEYRPILLDIQNGTTSTNNPDDLLDVSVFPNPTDGHFNISGDLTQYTVNVYDTKGRIVKSKVNQDGSNINTTINAGAGLYFIHIQDIEKQHSVVKKVMVNK